MSHLHLAEDHRRGVMTDEKMELGDAGTSLMTSSEARRPPPPSRFERVFQPCLGELVGTALFVFIGCVSVIENQEATGRLQPALVHGLAVAVLVSCMAEIRWVHDPPSPRTAQGEQKKDLNYLNWKLKLKLI